MEAAAAVQGLQAAGDNMDALAEAIIHAEFLDAIPGEDRQKLRAARTRMRALLAKQQGAAVAGSAGGSGATAAVAGSGPGAAAKSPHAKSSYDVSEFDTLASQYEALKWRMISKPGGATVKPDEFYRLHGLHQQVTQGDNTTERPMWADKGGLDFEGRARWDAWSAAAGLQADEAKLRFVQLYYELPPSCLWADTRGGVTA